MEKAKMLLKSRKFWAALVGLGIIVTKAFKPDLPLDEKEITNVIYVLAAYIVGTGVESSVRSEPAAVKKL